MNNLIASAHARFDLINSEDPNTVEVNGVARPRELLFAERLEAWVRKVDPTASDALLLASRCQHIKRWAFPRAEYPQGRVGYLKWRKDLTHKHAEIAATVMSELGITADTIAQVRAINLKEGLKTNPDSQAMEDALCLSFLEHEFAEFSAKYDDDKVIDIVQKTWRKMSPRGHELALTLPLQGRAKDLVGRALGG